MAISATLTFALETTGISIVRHILVSPQMSTLYYIHHDDFDGLAVPDQVMPSDIKRIVSYGKHTFHKRPYFFSPSMRQVYRYTPTDKLVERLTGYECGNSIRFSLVPDTTKRTSITVNDWMLTITGDMGKIDLPNGGR